MHIPQYDVVIDEQTKYYKVMQLAVGDYPERKITEFPTEKEAVDFILRMSSAIHWFLDMNIPHAVVINKYGFPSIGENERKSSLL